ncbi:MAG: T9SS type A sorting domain-containing protein [Candidatus Marinimicrobia bacterium]|nr:T9SS type A sorting domain-containing protein [Candidatus Neomarinimicrobiota bacterium]MBT3575967.1 T9SS type A sorting domain-containing protein [Candidatus Neomarinimicrobiota bacterium]MBT3679781.1 T9SS type A sorting domain-containing protein [Candidatus Neomarinimicrobiota bacterium]MBT3950430.1 T9SS type A sorting domain-containing protein [Candidatus Neomarinimicrobiota bacterium]MBT4253340.1 T9SS type A sorting domain-containing protein [Candidatus Neomarinimicrobiota bacterium]
MRYSPLALILWLGCFGHEVRAQSPNLYVNEFLASNSSVNIDPDFSRFTDWVEIYNAEDITIDVGGYYLTDNFNVPDKWQFPPNSIIQPGELLLVWTDGQDSLGHTSFKLSKDGEEIGLYDGLGNEIDTVTFPPQVTDISFGRDADGSQDWVYFSDPTPGAANSTPGTSGNLRGSAPVFSLQGGFYEGSISLEMESNLSNSEIRYTLDGSKPTNTSELYTGPINLHSTAVVRAVGYSPDLASSLVTTNTYIIDDSSELPLISLSTNPEYLWDEAFGILSNGEDCQGVETANSCQSWERPVHFEYFERDGALKVSQTTGLKVRGTTSCIFPRKQLGLYARDKYGEDEFSNQFFRDKYLASFKRLIFRPGAADGIGNQYWGTMFRDEMIATLVKDRMDIDYSASQPAVLFLNGEYFGVHNIRERVKQHYLAANYGYDSNKLDILENPYNGGVYQGDAQHYTNMLDFLGNNDISILENYEILKTLMDVDEFINYQIVELYIANIEWGNLNIQCWRPKTEDGKWRWVLWDVEGSYNIYPDGRTSHLVDPFQYGEDNFLRHRWLFEQLLTNTEFKNDFIQRFTAHLNTSFHPNRVMNIIDSLKAVIEPEMDRDINRWAGECQDDCGVSSPLCTISSFTAWEENIDRMRVFATGRPSRMRRHIFDKFGLTDIVSLTLSTAGSGAGSLLINDVEVTDSMATGGYFTDVPLRVSAIPHAGSRFVGWFSGDEAQSNSISIILSSDSTVTAVFEVNDQSFLGSTITSNTSLNLTESPFLAQRDVVVEANVTLSIEAGVEIQMADQANIIVYGSIVVNGNEEYPVTIGPEPNSVDQTWGGIYIENATGVSSLTHLRLQRASHGSDPFLQKAAISGNNSTVQLTDVTLSDVMLPVYMESCDVTINGISIDTHILEGDYIHIRKGTALIENSSFQGKDVARDVDVIDCDEVESALIRGNKFYNIQGDAIDFGDGSHSIVIQNNQIFNCLDKGISIGEHSSARIERNVILNCLEGIAIKDSSDAVINQNTLLGNDTGIAIYEKFLNSGGASAFIFNTIFSNSDAQAFRMDTKSSVSISNCQSNTSLLPGENHIYLNPMFTEYMHSSFYLEDESPCVDAGVAMVMDGQSTILNLSELEYAGEAPDIGAYENGFAYDRSGYFSHVIVDYYDLAQNFPNPFNPITTIRYALPNGGDVQLTIYDLRGRVVRRYTIDDQGPGQFDVDWNGSNSKGEVVGSGVYLCRLESGNYTETIKMVYLK